MKKRAPPRSGQPAVPKLRTSATLHEKLALRRVAFEQGRRLADVHAQLVSDFLQTQESLTPAAGARRVKEIPPDGQFLDLRPGARLASRARASADRLEVEIRAWAYSALVAFLAQHGGAAGAAPARRRA